MNSPPLHPLPPLPPSSNSSAWSSPPPLSSAASDAASLNGDARKRTHSLFSSGIKFGRKPKLPDTPTRSPSLGRRPSSRPSISEHHASAPLAPSSSYATSSSSTKPYGSPTSAPPTMSTFDGSAPLVARGSKQAQLLGVGVDLGGSIGGVRRTVGMAEDWEGWGGRAPVPHGGVEGKTSPRTAGVGESIAPWDYSNPRTKGAAMPQSRSASVSGLRASSKSRSYGEVQGSEASVKEKKKGGFMSLLKRKTSRGDLREDASIPEFEPSKPQSFDNSTLPAKLQARGDWSADPHLSSLKNSKSVRRPSKKPSLLPKDAVHVSRLATVFNVDPEISLDTNLDSMEGIVNLDAMTSAHGSISLDSRSPSFSSVSPAQEPDNLFPYPERNASLSSGASPRSASGAGFDSSLHPHRRPSLIPRRSSIDPNGGLAFPAMDPSRRTRDNSFSNSLLGANNGMGGFWAPNHQGLSALAREQPVSPLTLMPSRPSFSREMSSSTVTTIGSAGTDRVASIPPGVSNVRDGLAAWTAPDSWAVKGENGMAEHDSSEEEEEVDDGATLEELEELEEGGSTRARSEIGSIGGDEEPGQRLGLRTMGGPIRSGKAGRPGTADSKSGQKNFMIRIFRPDSTFSTLPVPLTVTASELVTTLGRKFQVNSNSGHALYLREKGLERRMGPNERPVLLQKRRFEQAGYTELDKLEDLGREDNSYLCKLVYKAPHASLSAAEDDIGESLEFVDLSGRNVETIPIFLYRHAHEIVSLNLSKNRPFDLPTDFVQLCTSLRELVLSHMGIKRIPQAVKECVSLTRLDISNNHIIELEHIALDELGELTSLKCHNNRLWNVPDYFSEFKMLKYLNLSNNRFDSFPSVVCDIAPLIELDISFNTITVIPPEIGGLQNLERLVVLANTINSLPQTLSALIHLKELDCRRNVITDLSAISGVARLEVLRCEYNQAVTLHANWEFMRILTASNNSITRFQLDGTGSTLTSLNLSFAKLSSLATDMFQHLGSVENLIFDSNQVRVLPEGVGSLSNLVNLSIKNNILDELPASIGRLQRLQTLQISGNNISTLPAEIWLCSQLTVLNASSNMLKEFPDVPLTNQQPETGVDELDVRKASTTAKAPSTGQGRITPPLALSLQKLYLGDNRLGDDVFAPISLMTELKTLNLSFNDIYEIPTSSLFKCQQLEELYLSGNKLTSLPPEDLERLVNLRLIYLNGNKLQTLPAELSNVKRLFALDVGSNVLKYNIANWPYDWNWNFNLELRYLNLSGNKRLEIKPGHQNNEVSAGPRSGKGRNMADFSALDKLHVLGLMDVTLMIPTTPDESEDRRVRTSGSELNNMGYGIADTLGSRVDTLSLVDIVVPRFRSREDEAIFGLFDAVNKGQNTGAKLVKYLQSNFTAVLTLELSRLKSGEVTSDALRRAFLGINRDYGNTLLPALESRRKDSEISLTDRASASARTGAAGIIVYIRKRRMYVANAGNALAVIAGRGGSARLVAKKHEPFDAAEIARIRTAEGWISHRGYVNDEVDISRSFGFYNVFPAINVSPNIEEIDIADTDEFIIIANRGLWEHMSYQAAVDVARTERSDPMIAAAKLRDLAISYGSSQNIMVMVLAIGDLFKAKRDYRSHRGTAQGNDDEGFYGVHKSGAAMRRGKEEGAGERYLNLLDREVPPPVGLVALVFTDIRNSTALWESNPGMQTAIRMHNQLLRRQLRAIGGYEVKTEGDAFMVSFPTVTSALLWCLTVQLELLREDWPQEILDSEEGKEIVNSRGELLYRGLSVRMGMHWGAPVCEADPITRRMDYFGPMVNRSARISAVAEGGQISASQDVIDIIQEVVVDHRVDPLLDKGESGEEEEEEGWELLDPNERRDVLALRRLGFGISELGERRLKGLETPEILSLLWPKSLRDRVKKANEQDDKVQVAEVYDPRSTILDVSLIKDIGRLVQRLEAAASALTHHEHRTVPPPSLPANQQLAVANKRKTAIIFPSILVYVRPDATDAELTALLESYTIRIENCISTLVLHQLGPLAEVLAALGGAIKTDPRTLMLSLSRYAGVMGMGAVE